MIKKNTIDSITLTNFMCHSHLELKFNHQITVIGGLNGSGKSAIMIAIGIALGMRTYSLERGTASKTLILNGKNFAKIELVLSNEVVRLKYAYYGSKIIIERILRRTGPAFLKIKNEKGEVFSTKKEDLEYILDNFQFHLKNPLNFLTQENSKKFLKNINSSSLYQLFMDGTELNDVIELHEEAKQKSFEMKAKLDILNRELEEIRQKKEKKTHDLHIVLESNKLDSLIEEMKKEIQWSKLFQLLENRKQLQDEIYDHEEAMSELVKEIKDNSAKIDEIKAAEKLREDEIKKMKTESEVRKEQLEQSVRDYDLEKREMESDLQEIRKALEEKQTKVTHLQKLGGFDQIIEKKKELIEKLEYETHLKEKVSKKNEKLAAQQSSANENQRVLQALKDRDKNLQRHVNYFQSLEKDRLSYFHKNMKSILNEIKKTSFKQNVIGPVGIFLELKDTRWRKALSVIMKNTLSDFIVFNKADKFKLISIFEKFNADFNIITPSKDDNKALDYYKVTGYKVALNVLNIKSEFKNIILNHLIISSNLERILLIEDRSVAYSALRKEARKGHKYPVKVAYTIEGDKIEYSDGYMSDSRSRVQRMYFEHNENKLQSILEEKQKIKYEIEQLQSDDDLDELQSEIEDLQGKLKKVTQSISDLKIETSLDIGTDLDKDIEELTKQISDLKTQKDEMEYNIKQNLNSRIIALKEFNEIITNKLPEKDLSVNSRIQKLYIDNNILERKWQVIGAKVDRKEAESKALLESYKEKAKVLNKSIPIIDNARPEEEIQLKIREYEIQKKLCLTLESETTLKSDIKELSALSDHKQCIITLFEEKILNTLNGIQQRIEKREAIKNQVAEKVARNFKKLTQKRNYEGILTFDYNYRTLDLEMKVNIMAGDKNTLSGGERSFAAMCLILSLWPFIACPVKVLDEFDVFMDNLNRDTILKELIDTFLKSELQIILITPLSFKIDTVDYIMLKHPNRTFNK